MFYAGRKFPDVSRKQRLCDDHVPEISERYGAVFKYNVTKDNRRLRKGLQYYGIILFFIVGAIVGTIITRIFMEKSALVACLLLLAVIVIMFIPQGMGRGNKVRKTVVQGAARRF